MATLAAEVIDCQEIILPTIFYLILCFTLLATIAITFRVHVAASVRVLPAGSAIIVSTVLKHHAKRQTIYKRLRPLVEFLISTSFSDERELRDLKYLRSAETNAIDKIIMKYWSEAPELIAVLNTLQRLDDIYSEEWDILLRTLRSVPRTKENPISVTIFPSFAGYVFDAAKSLNGVVELLLSLNFSRGISLMNNAIFWKELYKKLLQRKVFEYVDAPLSTFSINRRHVTRKFLVLDLDETLVHSYYFSRHRHAANIGSVPDFFMTINRSRICVYKRPHVDYFLDMVSSWYNLVIFTAAEEEYAKVIMKQLDGGRKILRTLFHRDHLTFVNNVKTKDLSIFSPNMCSILIIDNLPASYILNPDNAVPIKSWYLDFMDTALLNLLPMLDALACTENVQTVLSRWR